MADRRSILAILRIAKRSPELRLLSPNAIFGLDLLYSIASFNTDPKPDSYSYPANTDTSLAKP